MRTEGCGDGEDHVWRCLEPRVLHPHSCRERRALEGHAGQTRRAFSALIREIPCTLNPKPQTLNPFLSFFPFLGTQRASLGFLSERTRKMLFSTFSVIWASYGLVSFDSLTVIYYSDVSLLVTSSFLCLGMGQATQDLCGQGGFEAAGHLQKCAVSSERFPPHRHVATPIRCLCFAVPCLAVNTKPADRLCCSCSLCLSLATILPGYSGWTNTAIPSV